MRKSKEKAETIDRIEAAEKKKKPVRKRLIQKSPVRTPGKSFININKSPLTTYGVKIFDIDSYMISSRRSRQTDRLDLSNQETFENRNISPPHYNFRSGTIFKNTFIKESITRNSSDDSLIINFVDQIKARERA